jgi:hypothetical protein
MVRTDVVTVGRFPADGSLNRPDGMFVGGGAVEDDWAIMAPLGHRGTTS